MSAVLKPRETYQIVHPTLIDSVWPRVADGIRKALDTSSGEATVEDTKVGLKAGRTQLMLMERNGAHLGIVFMFLTFPRFKIARVLLAFGQDMAAVADLREAGERWAKDNGCRYVEAWVATPSRARLFARAGYTPSYTIIRKPL